MRSRKIAATTPSRALFFRLEPKSGVAVHGRTCYDEIRIIIGILREVHLRAVAPRSSYVTKETTFMNTAVSWCFLGYFLILIAERVQSLVRAITGQGIFPTGFDTYVNLLALISLAATVVLLLAFNGGFWRSLWQNQAPDYSVLTLTAGILLVSGMVHTEYTVAPVQFVAYGLLIVAMILQTVRTAPTAGSTFMLWYSLVFLISFSMAIPVMYRSGIPNAVLFHVIEAVVSLALVAFFTYMLRIVFVGDASNLLLWVPMLIAIVGNAVILALRWSEKVNLFLLIFTVLTALLFAVGKAVFALRK